MELIDSKNKWTSSDIMELNEFVANPENEKNDLQKLLDIAKTRVNRKERENLSDAISRKLNAL